MSYQHSRSRPAFGRSRRRLRVLAAVASLAWLAAGSGCSGSSTTNLIAPTAEKCQISVSGFTGSFGPAGGNGTATIATSRDCSWTAAAEGPWITFASPARGQGEGTLGFVVAANPAPAGRAGAITVNDQRLAVTQEPAPCRYAIEPRAQLAPSSGMRGTFTVSAMTGCQWSAASTVPWVSIVGTGRGNGAGSVSFDVAVNAGASRSASISVGGATFGLQQEPAPAAPEPPPAPQPPPPTPPPAPPPPAPPACQFFVTPSSLQFEAGDDTAIVQVTTTPGCAWQASESSPWISLGADSGTGPGTVTVSARANPGAPRTASLLVAGKAVTVQQAAAAAPPPPCEFSVSPTALSFDAEAGSDTVRVTTAGGCAWQSTESVTWLSVSGGSDTGPGTVTITVTENGGPSRTATLQVAGVTITVTQAAPRLSVRLSGRASNVSGTCPDVDFVVSNTAVVTSRQTNFSRGPCRDLRNGVDVVVEGTQEPGRPVDASRVTFREEDDEA
jgi:hypothetical protein